MKKILLSLFILLSTQAVRAQSFEPGYLVLSRGDTLRGQVENNFWSDPPTEIRFRSAATAAVATYPTRQLRGVALQSGRLLRREVLPLDHGAQTKLSNLPQGLRFEQHLDSVLADVLVEGPATLLEVKLDEVKHFLIRRDDRPYLELAERSFLAMRDGAQKIVDGNNYRSQLLLYFGDCPAAMTATKTAPFTAEGITGVVQTYNKECSSEQQAGKEWQLPEKARDRIAVQVGPVLGVRYDALRLHWESSTGTDPPKLDGVNLYGQLHGQGGLYFDVLMPGRRLALHTALLYSRYGRVTRVEEPTTNTQATVDSRGSMATLYAGMRGLCNWSAYQLLFGTGIELHYYHDDAQSITYHRNGVAVGGSSLYAGFAPTLLPYVEGGIRRDRLTLTLNVRRYGKEFIYDNYDSYRGHTWSFALALAYRLNGNTDKIGREYIDN